MIQELKVLFAKAFLILSVFSTEVLSTFLETFYSALQSGHMSSFNYSILGMVLSLFV